MHAATGAQVRRFRLTVGYDGSAYAGWQIQPNGLTVQEVIQRELSVVAGQPVKLHGSGRTDQGVHARAQEAHVDLATRMLPLQLCRALNARLPADIRIARVRTVSPQFHARRSARKKEYRYFIWNAEVMPPCERLYRTHVRKALDVDAMRRAAALLCGEHDFAAFTANPNREVVSTVRVIYALKVLQRGPRITIVAVGNGFLYKMVRSLAGWLMRVGEGAASADATRQVLASCERTARVPTASAHGLFLWKVSY